MESRMLKWDYDAWDEHGNHWHVAADLKAITPEYTERSLARMAQAIAEFAEDVEIKLI